MIFDEDEVRALLGLIAQHCTKSGFGYSDDPIWAGIQGKLSIALEVVSRRRPEPQPQERE